MKLKNKGFTLVELLVVISIIALLLSILMPTLRKAREMAKKTVCASQMKSLQLGVLMYVDDNDQTLPSPCVSNNSWQSVWIAKLYPYFNDGRVLEHDPSISSNKWVSTLYEVSKQKGLFRCPATPKFMTFSYTLNAGIAKNWSPVRQGRKVTEFKSQSSTLVISEVANNGRIWEFFFPTELAYVHGGFSNASFLDGHVEKVDEDQLWINETTYSLYRAMMYR